jgi:hypothetical protein
MDRGRSFHCEKKEHPERGKSYEGQWYADHKSEYPKNLPKSV